MDEDCDGLSDDSDASTASSSWVTYYRDSDSDGYGSTSRSVSQCEAPSGYVADATDCNDSSASINPAAAEVCDGANVDEDCDALADDLDSSVSGTTTYYEDSDGDTYGDATSTVATCDAPAGYVTNSTDCNDASATIKPGGTEVCDSANTDEDCDSLADDADSSATGKVSWYQDSDSDSYGSTTTASACDQPSGYVAAAGDCNDSSGSINPGATEICDSANTDEDCDGLADNSDSSATGTLSWYRDADSDTYGSSSVTTAACDQPSGYVADNTDCNDASATISPAGSEVCDAANTDEDCDGVADNSDPSATGAATEYLDADSDGYGDASHPVTACDAAAGYVTNDDDCNDGSASIKPSAAEVCDASNTDEDCDGLSDDADGSATGKSTWYSDSDTDGYGVVTSTTTACDLPVGYSALSTDCDDANSARNPGATEVCDSTNVDEDCDGYSDDSDSSVTGKTTWYRDLDSDNYGGSATTSSRCDQPSGYVATNTDCNDSSASINPGATEICDASNTDEDCDTVADDADASATGKTTYYQDSDSDTYGGTVSAAACDTVSGWVTTSTDCNDSSSAIHPGATETCDGVDQDCDSSIDDGLTVYYVDYDSDAYGDELGSGTCTYSSGMVANHTDCDETNAAIHPGATEICDSVDNDCDDLVDDDDAGLSATTYYYDADLDGYGTSSTTDQACVEPDGYVTDGTDCNDADLDINPAANEMYGDAVDEDCDGSTSPTYTCPASGVTVCSSSCDRSSVADALTYEPSGSTICIEASTWSESIDVTTTGTYTIQGRGRGSTTLTSYVRLRPQSSGSITLKGVHITGSSSTYGAVYMDDYNTSANPTVVLEDCEIDSSYTGVSMVRDSSGAGTFTVKNCDIDAGTSSSYAALYVYDGGGDGTTWRSYIYNNYLHGSYYGIRTNLTESSTETQYTYAENNTITGNTYGLYYYVSSSMYAYMYFYNNILYGDTYPEYGSTGTHTSFSAGKNDLYSYTTAYTGLSAGSGDITTNPLLDTTFSPPRLGAGSPAIGIGSTTYGVSTDHWGTARGTAYDLGAVEYP